MLYLLLGIIAIGVLLASDAGKQLLGFLIVLAIIAGFGYLAFWAVVFGIALISDEGFRESPIISVIGGVFLLFAVGSWLYTIYNDYRKGLLKDKIVNKCKQIWKENPKMTVFVVLSFLFTIIMFTKSL